MRPKMERFLGSTARLRFTSHDATTKAGGCLDEANAQRFRSRYRNVLTGGNREYVRHRLPPMPPLNAPLKASPAICGIVFATTKLKPSAS